MSLRPASLREIAERSDSIEEFGRHLKDWLHELRLVSSRTQAAATIIDEPPRLSNKFSRGEVADSWLGAYAEHMASRASSAPPEWAFASWRTAQEPIFDNGSTPTMRTMALIDSPLAFKRRNIFTPSVYLPLVLHAGRPRKAAKEKRRVNAERQRRFRVARLIELAALRKLKHSDA